MENTEFPRSCPFCNSPKITFNHIQTRLVCTRCRTRGPIGKNPQDALALWNQRFPSAPAKRRKEAWVTEEEQWGLTGQE